MTNDLRLPLKTALISPRSINDFLAVLHRHRASFKRLAAAVAASAECSEYALVKYSPLPDGFLFVRHKRSLSTSPTQLCLRLGFRLTAIASTITRSHPSLSTATKPQRAYWLNSLFLHLNEPCIWTQC